MDIEGAEFRYLTATLRSLRARFADVHREATSCLSRCDYTRLSECIAREIEIIDEQQRLLARFEILASRL